MNAETVMYCRNHRRRETGLTCRKCGKPICPECARSRPRIYIGYWCKQCDDALGPKSVHPPVSGSTPTKKFSIWKSLVLTLVSLALVIAFGPIGLAAVIGFISLRNIFWR
jgi:ribosomal protein L37AE/L43A